MKFVKAASKPAAYYAVRVGRKPGIFRTWTEANAQIQGFSKPDFKKFTNLEDAQTFFNDTNIMYEQTGSGGDRTVAWGPKPLPEVFRTSKESLWVFADGSCKGNSDVATQSHSAGWGVVVVRCTHMDELDTSTCKVVDEACGAVETAPGGPAYMGASHGKRRSQTDETPCLQYSTYTDRILII